MTIVTLVGIDPGLQDTGVVAITIDSDKLTTVINHCKVTGGTAGVAVAVFEWVDDLSWSKPVDTYTWIEKYTERGNSYATHGPMRQLEQQLKMLLPEAKLLDNMGIKNVVTQEFMQLLDVWKFPTVTHHQDLRSAARIALYGALKDEQLNRLLTDLLKKGLSL